MDLTVEIHEEGQGYWAHVVELPGCFASGLTLDELQEALGESIGLYLWDSPIDLGDQALTVGKLSIEIDPLGY